MEIVSQDPLLQFVWHTRSLAKGTYVVLPEAEKRAFLDYYSALFGDVPEFVFDSSDLTEWVDVPAGEPLKVETGFSLQTLMSFVEAHGYERTNYCERQYQWARRGFVLDVYSDNLYRFEVATDETIDSIRLVDPETQMTRSRLVVAVLWPRFETVMPIKQVKKAIVYDPQKVFRELQAKGEDLTFSFEEYTVRPIVDFLQPPQVTLKDLASHQGSVVLVTEFPDVFMKRLGWPLFGSILDGIERGAAQFLVQGRIRTPFRLNGVDVVADKEGIIWSSGTSRPPILSWNELKVGDPVLHTDRGVGLYNGLVDLDGKTYFEVLYKDGRVLVPLERSQKLYRVPKTIAIDSLGPLRWAQRKKWLNERGLSIRRFLENRFAMRKMIAAPAIAPDPEVESAFASTFPYVETLDQMGALRELCDWLKIPHPEEALIIGESGVGKTEVIMRIAVRVASSGLKTVIVVPTRVLVDQYMAAYSDRVAAAGLMLTDKPDGHYDILVGTHSVLSEGSYDERLALVVYDEEQKFGVSHKTWFQKRYPWVRVIYSSATPIPRTFFLARKGYIKLIRMHELPYGRQRVRLFADEYRETLVKRIISAELGRGGLVLYVHPTIRGIDYRAMELQHAFPDARVEVLHAQMSDRDITAIFKSLQRGEIQVLVATTIVEAGLDIPIANTLIVEDSTHLGVSQMYQLKGRVGRGETRAFAWFLYPPGTSAATMRRIHDTVQLLNVSDTVALAELDVHYRGIGEVFGLRQHGVLRQEEVFAVDALLEESYKEQETVIEGFPIPMDVPEWFMPEPERSTLIKSILDAESERELLGLFVFTQDTGGRVPPRVKGLFAYALLKILGSQKGVAVIKFSPKGVFLKALEEEDFRVEGSTWPRILDLLRHLGGKDEWLEILRE